MSVQKTPVARSLSAFTRGRVLAEIKKRGYALPCHLVDVDGTLVTVAFDVDGIILPQVTIPIFGTQWQRVPYQEGEQGFTVALDVDISRLAGLGTALPSLSQLAANLSSLFWLPAGNVDFSPVADPNVHYIIGPNGVVLQDADGLAVVKAHPQDGISLTFGGHSITVTGAGITLDGILWDAHGHGPGTYVAGSTPVTGEAGPPEAGLA
jgi:hypothetical protein